MVDRKENEATKSAKKEESFIFKSKYMCALENK